MIRTLFAIAVVSAAGYLLMNEYPTLHRWLGNAADRVPVAVSAIRQSLPRPQEPSASGETSGPQPDRGSPDVPFVAPVAEHPGDETRSPRSPFTPDSRAIADHSSSPTGVLRSDDTMTIGPETFASPAEVRGDLRRTERIDALRRLAEEMTLRSVGYTASR